MRFISTIENETLEELVTRAYDLGTAPSDKLIQRAETGLLEANPFLTTLDVVPDGSMVAVPDQPDLVASAEALAADQAGVAVTADQFTGAIALSGNELLASIASAVQEANEALQEFGGADIQQLAASNDQLSAALPQLTSAATARVEASQQLEEYSKTALAQVEKDLEALRTAFG
jgi:hypothetical protein